jgi:transposase
MAKKLFPGLMLVLRRLTQTEEERCPDERPRSFLTEAVYNILAELSKRRTVAIHVQQRAEIIQQAFAKRNNTEIGRHLGLGRHAVGRWRRRWSESVDALLAIEMHEPHAALERAVVDVLSDAHRSGSPGRFSAQQIAQVISTACESPRARGRPVDTWTGRELADEVIQREVVDSISASRVNDLLRTVHLQPQRRKYWCFTTEKDHALFRSQVDQICKVYLDAQKMFETQNTRTICVDEMTGVAANERRAESKPALPGQIAKVECQYTKHGTLSLTGSWDVVQGQMIHATVDETRTADDFAHHIRRTVQVDPAANWIVVADNLNTHYGEAMVRTVAELIGFEEHALGDKKKRQGVLGCVRSRREFLTDPSHRIRFVFTPKHSSWLNQIEVIFGVIGRRVIRPGSFTSQQDLKDKLLAFIDYYNRTFAKPLDWTYSGRPTASRRDQRPRTWREKTQNRQLDQILALVAP